MAVDGILNRITIGYISLEVSRFLFSEGIYTFSTDRHLPFMSPVYLVLIMEILKFITAFLYAMKSKNLFSATSMHWFVLQSFLYFFNNMMYLNALSLTSAGVLSMLLHMRLPVTAALHHIFLKPQTKVTAWISLLFIFSGVTLSQVNKSMSIDLNTFAMCFFISVSSAIAGILNEKLLKDLDMPFWDQQFRLYGFGVLASLAYALISADPFIRMESLNTATVTFTILCIVFGTAGGLVTGFLVYKLNSIVKLISQAFVTLFVTILIYFFFGTFNSEIEFFIPGMIIFFLATCAYSRITAIRNDYEGVDELNTKPSANGILFNRFKWHVLCLVILGLLIVIFDSMTFSEKMQEKNSYLLDSKLRDLTRLGCFVDPFSLEKKTMNQTGYSVVSDIEEECRDFTKENLLACEIPKVVHLVLMGPSFKFHHYLSIKSIHDNIKPTQIFIHGYNFPTSDLFQKASKEFNFLLVQSRHVDFIYDRPVGGFEHKSDLIRIESILRFGGIYFDLDVYALKPIDNFLKEDTVLGRQGNETGINNGMIFGKRCSSFLRRWHSSYQEFDESQWDYHSIRMPYKLYMEDKSDLRMEEVFLDNSYYNNQFLSDVYKPEYWKPIKAVHAFYRDYDVQHDFENIKNATNNFGRFARKLLYNSTTF